MKKTIVSILAALVFLFSGTSMAFAAGPVEYTIDVRNRTGSPVEFNYTGVDEVIHTISIPVGVSSLTITEGVYSYWASPECGHIAGTLNISQQRDILMLDCSNAKPSVAVTRIEHSGAALPVYTRCLNLVGGLNANSFLYYEYNFYDWNDYVDDANDWAAFGTFCYDKPATEEQFEWASIWLDGEDYYYLYLPNGISNSIYGNCDGWNDYGEGFYYLDYYQGNLYLNCP